MVTDGDEISSPRYPSDDEPTFIPDTQQEKQIVVRPMEAPIYKKRSISTSSGENLSDHAFLRKKSKKISRSAQSSEEDKPHTSDESNS